MMTMLKKTGEGRRRGEREGGKEMPCHDIDSRKGDEGGGQKKESIGGQGIAIESLKVIKNEIIVNLP